MSIPPTKRDEAMLAWSRYGTDKKLMLYRAGCTPFEVRKYCDAYWRDLPYRIQDALTYGPDQPKEQPC